MELEPGQGTRASEAKQNKTKRRETEADLGVGCLRSPQSSGPTSYSYRVLGLGNVGFAFGPDIQTVVVQGLSGCFALGPFGWVGCIYSYGRAFLVSPMYRPYFFRLGILITGHSLKRICRAGEDTSRDTSVGLNDILSFVSLLDWQPCS